MRRWVVIRHADGIRYRVVEAGETVPNEAPIQQLVFDACIRARVCAQALNYAYELGRCDVRGEIADAFGLEYVED